MLAPAATVNNTAQARVNMPAMVRSAVDAMDRQGRDSSGFIALLKNSGPHFSYMLALEKGRLLNKICGMSRGDERDDIIAQAALLKNIIDTLEAMK